METKEKQTNKKGIIYTLAGLCLSIYLSAQQQINQKPGIKEIAQDNTASFYIIGSVVLLGVVAYVIFNIFNKKEEKEQENQIHTFHRNHNRHHHRIVKKSA